MILTVSYIFIITGFIIYFYARRMKKKNPNLKVGTVMDVAVLEDSGYQLIVSYSLDEGDTFIEDFVFSKKLPMVGTEIIVLIHKDDSVSIYQGTLKLLLLAWVCWLIGMFLCLFAR